MYQYRKVLRSGVLRQQLAACVIVRDQSSTPEKLPATKAPRKIVTSSKIATETAAIVTGKPAKKSKRLERIREMCTANLKLFYTTPGSVLKPASRWRFLLLRIILVHHCLARCRASQDPAADLQRFDHQCARICSQIQRIL